MKKHSPVLSQLLLKFPVTLKIGKILVTCPIESLAIHFIFFPVKAGKDSTELFLPALNERLCGYWT